MKKETIEALRKGIESWKNVNNMPKIVARIAILKQIENGETIAEGAYTPKNGIKKDPADFIINNLRIESIFSYLANTIENSKYTENSETLKDFVPSLKRLCKESETVKKANVTLKETVKNLESEMGTIKAKKSAIASYFTKYPILDKTPLYEIVNSIIDDTIADIVSIETLNSIGYKTVRELVDNKKIVFVLPIDAK
jgi:archaellum component FlaC